MLISYNWLRELTGTKLNPQEIRERLTNVGLAVDAVEERDADYVLDVEVPSNRGDCLSHVGIARELAVIENAGVQSPKSQIENAKGKTSDFASVEIRDPDLCPRYAARIVRGVKIAPSPEWLRKRLEVLGQRPINNVADITNYVLHELGQPLHAFDLAKLTESRIIVRCAEKDETITTLDGVERNLDKEMLVIADPRRPVAVAGVMGGEDSEISNATTDVLIESAYFDPASACTRKPRIDLSVARILKAYRRHRRDAWRSFAKSRAALPRKTRSMSIRHERIRRSSAFAPNELKRLPVSASLRRKVFEFSNRSASVSPRRRPQDSSSQFLRGGTTLQLRRI